MSNGNMDVTSPETTNVRKDVKEKLLSCRCVVHQPNVNMETVVAEYDKLASVYDEVSERFYFQMSNGKFERSGDPLPCRVAVIFCWALTEFPLLPTFCFFLGGEGEISSN